MKVSLNWAQYFSNVDLKSIPKETLLKRIGAQLGAIEEVTEWGPRYDGIVVARVISVEKHPNADKLHVCRIDDGGVAVGVERGEDGLVQVVCGANNVVAGMTVAWLQPGSTVPASIDKDPFVLEARDIRGQKSNGMLASERELGISDEHEGILDIKASDVGEALMQPGTAFKRLYGLDDLVIDLENKMFTHRPDCFGILGVARELAGISGAAYKSPDWYAQPSKPGSAGTLPFVSKNEIPALVPRFSAQVVENVSVKVSPVFMQSGLTRVGIRPINNLVDYTNWYMQLTAQPTHAFDYDKIKALSNGAPTIFPRMAEDGEELELLNGKTIKLTTDDMVIATDKKAVALAGVMGGAETEVDVSTKNIIIECATFDMYTVRRTSMRHGLFTDAVTRFNKGQSPLQNDRVLSKLVSDICESTGATPGKVYDSLSTKAVSPAVAVTTQFINSRLGSNLTAEAIATLLQNVEIPTVVSGDILTLTPPFWRMDIELPEDVVEEVGRLYGFDKLTVALPGRSTRAPKRDPLLSLKQSIRARLSAMGANELLTYSFVQGDMLQKIGIDPKEQAIHIRNALSPELQYYRTSLTPSLLSKVHANIKSDMVRGDNNHFALFEMGKAHLKGLQDDDSLPLELERLALVVTADDKTAKVHGGDAYYLAKKYLSDLLSQKLLFLPLTDATDPITIPFAAHRSAQVLLGKQKIGVMGEFSQKALRTFKLPLFSAGFEVDLLAISEMFKQQTYTVMPTLPKTQQDITVETADDESYESVFEKIWTALELAEKEQGYVVSAGPRDIFADTTNKTTRYTFRIWLSHPHKTLRTEEVNTLLDKVTSEQGLKRI
jgi:phenylalanyl-tRNA synthetase beta chain